MNSSDFHEKLYNYKEKHNLMHSGMTSRFLDGVMKNVKYYKRIGSPGKYRYFYTKDEYDAFINNQPTKSGAAAEAAKKNPSPSYGYSSSFTSTSKNNGSAADAAAREADKRQEWENKKKTSQVGKNEAERLKVSGASAEAEREAAKRQAYEDRLKGKTGAAAEDAREAAKRDAYSRKKNYDRQKEAMKMFKVRRSYEPAEFEQLAKDAGVADVNNMTLADQIKIVKKDAEIREDLDKFAKWYNKGLKEKTAYFRLLKEAGINIKDPSKLSYDDAKKLIKVYNINRKLFDNIMNI